MTQAPVPNTASLVKLFASACRILLPVAPRSKLISVTTSIFIGCYGRSVWWYLCYSRGYGRLIFEGSTGQAI